MTTPPVAVTFDFWNTIAVEPPGLLNRRRFDAVRAACDGLGISTTDDALREYLAAAGAIHQNAWTSGRAFHPQDAAHHLVDAVAATRSEPDRAAIVAAYLNAGASVALTYAPGIADTLHHLRVAGVHLAIVCDVGLTASTLLRAAMDREGLLDHFDTWAFSDETHVFKPAPEIFLAALDGHDPAHSAHVGDLRRTDVVGFRALGMTTVRYRGIADDQTDGPEADHVVDHHRELLEVLRHSRASEAASGRAIPRETADAA